MKDGTRKQDSKKARKQESKQDKVCLGIKNNLKNTWEKQKKKSKTTK